MSRQELGLYVHIPFCVRKCCYCDFNSGPAAEPLRAAYLHALEREIRTSPWRGACARTLFLGGGTPSELRVSELASLVHALEQSFYFTPAAEWTLECNPGTVDRSALQEFRRLGFNRLSLGVQSFQDRHLRALRRIHDGREALQAYREAREAGFDNINLDLLFALPGQSLEEWDADLSWALELEPDHLSLYHLTIEPGTEFGRRQAAGERLEVDEELGAKMYEHALDRTEAAGFEQYEISSFARPGQECQHNLGYWLRKPYLGFGVSAASYLDGRRWTNTANLRRYIESAAQGKVPRLQDELLSTKEALAEEIMLRLRTREGLSLPSLSRTYRLPVEELYRPQVDFLTREGLLEEVAGRILLTRRGKLLANEVTLHFFSG